MELAGFGRPLSWTWRFHHRAVCCQLGSGWEQGLGPDPHQTGNLQVCLCSFALPSRSTCCWKGKGQNGRGLSGETKLLCFNQIQACYFHKIQCPVLPRAAAHFVARGIQFLNTYNLGSANAVKIEVASIGGDKDVFYDWSFRGLQDTLCDYVVRHYFQNCWIEGSTVFMFGFGQSMYEIYLTES